MRQVNELIPIKHPRMKVAALIGIGLTVAYGISSLIAVFSDKTSYSVATKQFNNVKGDDRYFFGEKKVVYQFEEGYITYEYIIQDGVIVMKNDESEKALVQFNEVTLFDYSKNTYYVWTY